jgi:hypothetical protein
MQAERRWRKVILHYEDQAGNTRKTLILRHFISHRGVHED